VSNAAFSSLLFDVLGKLFSRVLAQARQIQKIAPLLAKIPVSVHFFHATVMYAHVNVRTQAHAVLTA
jgi:hypothetical protein